MENKKALIVVDMQNDFVDGSLGTDEAVQIVTNVVGEVKEKSDEGYEIIFTQDTHPEDYLESFEGQNLPVEHCIKGTEGWKIIPELEELEIDKEIIQKPTFGSLELIDRLKEEPLEEIELIGLCTDICVLSNAILLRAAYPDTKITVKENCCAGVTPEKHNAALEVLKSNQIEIL